LTVVIVIDPVFLVSLYDVQPPRSLTEGASSPCSWLVRLSLHGAIHVSINGRIVALADISCIAGQ